ncbi:MAG: CotH kinase family protein, partial [Sphingomonadales bacterium]
MKVSALVFLFLVICGHLRAQRFTATGPKAILEVNTTQVPNIIPISVSGLPTSIGSSFGLESVCFNIKHPELNNLTVKLVSPDGTKVTLFQRVEADSADFIGTCINDEGLAIYNGSAPFTGSFRSTLPLGQVNNGQNPNGTWALWIYDDIPNAGSAGTFIDVALNFGSMPARPFGFSSSDLPIVEIITTNRAINNYVKEKVVFRTYDSPSGINNMQKDAPTFDGTAYIEWQGWSAPSLPKKNFDFDVANSLGAKIDVPLLGLPAENDWVLKAEYNDRTLMKNHLVFDLFNKMGRYAPRTRFCEVVLDGEYVGVYTLQEKVKR